MTVAAVFTEILSNVMLIPANISVNGNNMIVEMVIGKTKAKERNNIPKTVVF